RITSCDHYAGGKIHGEMQTLDRRDGLALQNDGVAHRLHAEHSDIVLHQNWKDFAAEAVVMCVHHVERHLYGVESEAVSKSGVEHLQVDVGTLVSREPDVANPARLLRLQHGLHATARPKNSIWIGIAYHFMELHQVHMVGLKAAEGLIDRGGDSFASLAIDLAHQKRFLVITIP